ncbi:hypothetical protein SERLADRAFT_376182 [Serpula lacrymans var. lacrymans S7.9]|nr:uncharacterized protein SERLADRAFT_376182 [Serpula lacrymans var. lacrymans S7.9]EGO30915.1 hypothetical protein SERLADRAFT_376182 [Serpula lacrymans var. lacrymans S7.9]
MGQLEFSSLRTAVQHERSSPDHARYVSEFDWWDRDESGWEVDVPPLTSEGLRAQERQTHVDHVHEMVPFWRKAVEAAERGEVLKLEEFLDRLEARGPWGTFDDIWGAQPGTGKDAWSAWDDDGGDKHWGKVEPWAARDDDSVKRPARTNSFWGDKPDHLPRQECHPRSGIGERVVGQGLGRKKAVDSPRKDDTYGFVEAIARQEAANEERKQRMHVFYKMPTHQKVQKIQEMIYFLRANPM